ncbi:alginate O-acetyltransferase AlgX-related protein [Undibacterium sp. Di26W]|uniref:alginate O-acetyltransferase AlgX-related protein n=1 Tax=Undibacterium sp. Di26W TaxID=3413035 RepID=UPI003BF177EC
MISDLKTRRYLLAFLAPVFLFSFLLFSLSLYFKFPIDDMVRAGLWVQRDFIEHSAQPVVYRRESGKDLAAPAILVLGDSFSDENNWQSFLPADKQFKALTFHYKNVGCATNWMRWNLQQESPSVHTVIVQVIERDFVWRFRQSACRDDVPIPVEISSGIIVRRHPVFKLIKDPEYLLRLTKNSWSTEQLRDRIVVGDAVNVSMSTGKLFSNNKSDRLLYFRTDERKKEWDKAMITRCIANLKALQEMAAQRGWKFLLIIVPDKSTVYKQFVRNAEDRINYPDVSSEIDAAGINQVKLLPYFEQQASQVVDLYRPGDTHLSFRGYQLMAKKIQEKL